MKEGELDGFKSRVNAILTTQANSKGFGESQVKYNRDNLDDDAIDSE